MDLLLLIDDDKSHYVYIKDFNTFMFQKTKNKNKKWFCKSCLQCFSSEKVMINHTEDCLSINGKQSVDVEEGIIKFKNYYRKISSVIHKMLRFMKDHIRRNIMIMFLVVLLTKVLY